MTREEIRDELISIIDGLEESELLDAYNEYCDETNGFDDVIYWNDEEELDMVFNEQSPYYVLCRAYYGEYRLGDRFFKFDGYGNLRSFNVLSEEIFLDELVDWILDNDTDLGNSEIRNLLDESGDFEESVRINRRSSRRINESVDDSFADSLIGLPYDKAVKKIENAKLYLSEYGISGGGTPAPGKTEYSSFQDEDKTVELVIKYKLSKNPKYPNSLTNGEIIDAYIY